MVLTYKCKNLDCINYDIEVSHFRVLPSFDGKRKICVACEGRRSDERVGPLLLAPFGLSDNQESVGPWTASEKSFVGCSRQLSASPRAEVVGVRLPNAAASVYGPFATIRTPAQCGCSATDLFWEASIGDAFDKTSTPGERNKPRPLVQRCPPVFFLS